MSKGYKNDLVNVIRRLQSILSIVLFFIIFAFFWNVTEFNISDIQLSRWGSGDITLNWLWNSIIILLLASILFNSIIFIKKHIRLKYKTVPYVMFSFVSLCLFFVGLFNLDHNLIHNIATYLYFFIYPLTIFVMAYLNRKTLLYREWFIHLMFSVSMVVLPLSCISIFNGMAISEIIHIVIVCLWNLYVTFKNF